jgi:hypothetical protein
LSLAKASVVDIDYFTLIPDDGELCGWPVIPKLSRLNRRNDSDGEAVLLDAGTPSVFKSKLGQ